MRMSGSWTKGNFRKRQPGQVRKSTAFDTILQVRVQIPDRRYFSRLMSVIVSKPQKFSYGVCQLGFPGKRSKCAPPGCTRQPFQKGQKDFLDSLFFP